MRNYELAFIVRPDTNDEEVNGVIEQVTQFIKNLDGQVDTVDIWGRRPLAYPISRHKEGVYVLFLAKMDPATLLELERNIKLTEDIIRYLLIKLEE